MNFKIHAWQVDGYVKLTPIFAKKLNEIINLKFKSINNFSKVCFVNRKALEGICQRRDWRHKGFAKVSRLFYVTDFLNLKRKSVEKQIKLFMDSKTGAYNRVYYNPFPFSITPLVIRLAAHIIGDGSVGKGYFRYSQQNINHILKLSENIIKPIKHLKKNKNFNKDGSFKEYQFNIPTIIIKSLCQALSINRCDIKTDLFLQKCLQLPRDYRIQVLCGIFVDEGSVEGRTIRMIDKKIIENICFLIDSLGYIRGEMSNSTEKLYYNDLPYFVKTFNVQLAVIGLMKFADDIKKMIQKYGTLAGLWTKQRSLQIELRKHDINYLINIEEFQKLREATIKEFKKKQFIKIKGIVKKSKRNRDSIEYLFNTLSKKGIIERVSRGTYSLCKNNS